MLLSRIHLDPRCREVRRDLADPYQMHATLCRAFAPAQTKCPPGSLLWRLEPETDAQGRPRLLLQSASTPNWAALGIAGWLAEASAPVDVAARLRLDELATGRRFRFRLRANPCVTRAGKRLGLMQGVDQERWLERQGERCGFALPRLDAADFLGDEAPRPDVRISQEGMVRGRQHDGNALRIFAVLYDGLLTVTDATRFREALQSGIGHGKAIGLGLLSVAPA